ncbi:MAG: hypothetical protein ABWZ38_12370, partial [Candidatus Binatia bacterium]
TKKLSGMRPMGRATAYVQIVQNVQVVQNDRRMFDGLSDLNGLNDLNPTQLIYLCALWLKAIDCGRVVAESF